MYNSANLAAKIKEVATKRGIVIKDMLNDCELSKNTLSSLYHGKAVAYDSLATMADYLDCSVDYLLERNKYAVTEGLLTENQEKCFTLFNRLNEVDQGKVLERMLTLYEGYSDKSEETVSGSADVSASA